MCELGRRRLLIGVLAGGLAGCGEMWSARERPTASGAYRSVAAKGYPTDGLLVDAEWVAARLGNPRLRLVDCSPLARYRTGHLPRAAHLWWQDTIEINNPVYGMLVGQPRRGQLVGRLGIDESSIVVAYDDEGGRWAARLVWLLEFSGHRQVFLLDGGVQQWLASGQALTTSAPPPATRPYQGREEPGRIMVADEVVDLVGAGGSVVDGRSQSERSETWRGRLRLGSIPGASSRPWDNLLGPTGGVRPAAELRRAYAAALTSSLPVAVYGLFGAGAALPYVVLRTLGAADVRLYDGSWAEWGAVRSTTAWPVTPLSGAAQQAGESGADA